MVSQAIKAETRLNEMIMVRQAIQTETGWSNESLDSKEGILLRKVDLLVETGVNLHNIHLKAQVNLKLKGDSVLISIEVTWIFLIEVEELTLSMAHQVGQMNLEQNQATHQIIPQHQITHL